MDRCRSTIREVSNDLCNSELMFKLLVPILKLFCFFCRYL